MNKTFLTPVNAGNYIAGFGTAKGASLRSIDYTTGEVRFSLVAADDTVSSVVNGIVVPEVTEGTVAASIRNAVAAAKA